MIIVGIDEAGVGSWAGPLVVASVAIEEGVELPRLVRDSKTLNESQRESLIDGIYRAATRVVIDRAHSTLIDKMGGVWRTWDILVGRVVEANLSLGPKRVIVDGDRIVGRNQWVKCEPKADSKYPEVSAASIVAKYAQTCAMEDLHEAFPQYGFDSNHGYGTRTHMEALKKYGSTSHHRQTFRPVWDHSFKGLGDLLIIERREIS